MAARITGYMAAHAHLPTPITLTMSSNHGIARTDKVVVVMGPTGAGKSTFINYATRGDGGGIGHNLRSHTAEMIVTKAKIGDDVVAFVDTPGFDDTFKSDIEILSMIAEFLVELHQEGVKVNSLLYLHRITDNRMAGSPLRNLQLFTSLCGTVAMTHATLVTTMWGRASEAVGRPRLEELQKVFWNNMIQAGCKVERFGDSQQSALHIINSDNKGEGVLLTEEIVVKHRKLKATEAGITLNKQLDKLLQERKAANQRIQQLAQGEDNARTRDNLMLELQKLDKGIQDVASQISKLRLPFTTVLRRLFFGGAPVSTVGGTS